MRRYSDDRPQRHEPDHSAFDVLLVLVFFFILWLVGVYMVNVGPLPHPF